MEKKTKPVKKPKTQAAGDPPPKCPNGYYWNGSACVLNVGN